MTRLADRLVLVLNAGSSSLKFAVFRANAERRDPVWRGQVEGIGATPRLAAGEDAPVDVDCRTHAEALSAILAWAAARGLSLASLDGVGHRVVHGGARHGAPLAVEADSLAALEELANLAPLHNGFGLAAIRAIQAMAPRLPQVACFDTAFHATQPDVAARFALPPPFHEEGYRRYGFHGLNYEHVVDELPRLSGKPLPSRLLVFHLGNGSSICAIVDARAVATTMGYSTLDGLTMGTRCGSIDPGLLIALMRDKHMGVEALETLLYKRAGLLGLSGVTNDMRALLASPDPACVRAVEHYCYWAARHAASLLAASGGLDAVVFTGGIGANSGAVRAGIVRHLAWLGLELDASANAANAVRLSPDTGGKEIWIVPADEETAIARHTLAALARRGGAAVSSRG